MEERALSIRDYSTAVSVTTNRRNYTVSLFEKKAKLVRDVDFGVIPKTKKPTLFKAGAEKIVSGLGLSSHFTIEKAEENFADGFFFYRVKCVLFYALPDGKEIVVTEGVGSANSREKGTGQQSPFDGANTRLKMAKKRAFVDACLTVGCLSAMFSQDLENEDFMKEDVTVTDENAKITQNQVKRLFTIATTYNVDKLKCSEIIKAAGYESSKDIAQKDYDAICREIEKAGGVIEV